MDPRIATTDDPLLDADVQSGVVGDSSEHTQPRIVLTDQVSRTRRLMGIGAAVVIVYALATLVVATMSADLGFFTYQGSQVIGVEGGSAAAEAGLIAGDLVIAVNGVATPDSAARGAALADIYPGQHLVLAVERASEVATVSFSVDRHLPLGSAAGVLLATLLLVIALMADRGGPGSLPRTFFRSTLVYVIFLAGIFSPYAVLGTTILALPFFYALTLVAPVTCHFMLKFPAGRTSFTRLELAAIYGPPLGLASFLAYKHIVFVFFGGVHPDHHRVSMLGGVLCIILAAAYLSIGAIARGRRLRRKRDLIDPIAARWLHIGHVILTAPLLVGAAYALRDTSSFIAGGFRPFVAIAMVGGSACVVLAMTRTPFGELDRMWRRSSGYFLATSLAVGLYLACIAALGGTASVLSGGDFSAALAATLAAAVVFGPMRMRLQRMVDERFARDRSRARHLLREAAESAAATLEVEVLESGAVHRVRTALAAEGAAIYVADDSAAGGWRRTALAGLVPIGERLRAGDPLARQLDAALTARQARAVCANMVVVPLPVDERAPAALVVAPRDQQRLDDEERELLVTLGANLVVALGNARAHGALRDLTQRLQREVEIAEERRREIARLKERAEAENRELIGQLAARSGRAPVIGRGLAATFELVQRVARSETSVLISGETGVGKELVARAIHAASPRRDGPFVVVDCGAIAAGVAESALFGHEKGAFTGAIRATKGSFRAAEGGTIFLDEIGELPPELQPKLLRVLQEREVIPVGSATSLPVDVRVLAGTNRDLVAEVQAGAFRQDLLYRLQVVDIKVPPLRQRAGDIPALAEHFLAIHAERARRPLKRLAADALTALLDYEWPGNVRELEHALEAAAVYAVGDEIRAADLPIYDQLFRQKSKRAISESGPHEIDGAPKAGLRETLGDLEADRVREALRQHGGNRSRAAKALGMSRGALLRRIKRYQLESPDGVVD